MADEQEGVKFKKKKLGWPKVSKESNEPFKTEIKSNQKVLLLDTLRTSRNKRQEKKADKSSTIYALP